MKIAIITWHSWKNFGTALQATALNQLLNRLGYNCETIRYAPDYSKDTWQKTLRDLAERIICQEKCRETKNRQWVTSEKEKAFDLFLEKNMRFNTKTSYYGTMLSLYRYDAVIYGSDQIWMPWFFKDEMFGKWVNPNKRIAYAVSMGDVKQLEAVPEKIRKRIIQYIKEARVLSFREKRTVEYLLDRYNVASQCVVDPTLLIEKEIWESMECKIADIPERYLFAYLLDDSDRKEKIDYIYQVANTRNLQVIFSAGYEEDALIVPTSELYTDIGPGEFLTLVHHAALVITDSFHGIVFSAIYSTPFIPIERKVGEGPIGQNERLYSFLSLIGMNGHISKLEIESDFVNLNRTDINKIHIRIEEERKKSIRFLEESIITVVNE